MNPVLGRRRDAVKRGSVVAATAVVAVQFAAGCASSTTAIPTVTATVTVVAEAPVASPAVSGSDDWLPSELRGRWCTSEGDGCLDGAQLISEYPDATVESVEAVAAVPGALDYALCLDLLEQGSCGMATSMYLRYFPAGVVWDCVEVEVVGEGWPGCSPDFSSAHDVSRPRVVVLFNHQHDTMYRDSEPLYRSAG